MKQLIIILLSCYCLVFSLSAQNYIAEYESENIKSCLIFNTDTWRYDATEFWSTEISVTSNDVDVDELNRSTEKTVKSFSTFNFRSLDKNYYLDEEALPVFLSDKYVIKGELVKPEWSIVSDSIKMIENYTCLMANGFVCGRNYTVWFTPDISVSAGPWKLWGLPGLIVSAHSDDNVVKITMTSLKQTDILPKEPEIIQTITPEEFKIVLREGAKKISRKIRALVSGISDSAEVTTFVLLDKYPDKSFIE
ncbi:MAG: GLPGLI family protein [Candidatus Symbiothrix sp.]|jgi:GLPGLI family protein|nr:GLPGLI family protein [Candidatus Symbiothrix sp.]